MKKKGLLLSFGLALCLSAGVAAGGGTVNAQTGYTFKDPRWTDEVEALATLQEGEFTVAVLGDTQKTIEYNPEMIENTMNYFVQNKERLNLQYVISVGDIVDDVDLELDGKADPDAQLTSAKRAYSILKENGVPFALTLGNHDYEDMAFNNRTMDMFNRYFPLSFYDGMETYAGSMNDTLENTYHYFNVGNQKYMIVVLGHNPTDEILDWANDVVAANGDRKTIVVTHGYLDGGGYAPLGPVPEYYSGGYGQRTPHGDHIWEKFVSRHENIFMVFCGHELGLDNDRIVRCDVYGEHGNIVHQFMTNPADIEYGGAGLTALFTFRKDGTVDVRYFCPTNGKYYNSASQFQFDVEDNLPENLSGKTTQNVINRGPLTENYIAYPEGDERFLSTADAFGGIKLFSDGVAPTENGGFIDYRFSAGENEVFRDARITITYQSQSRRGGIALATSKDGKNFSLYGSEDGISQSARLSGSVYTAKFVPTDSVSDSSDIYFRLIFLNGSVDNVRLQTLNVELSEIKVSDDQSGEFGVSLRFSDYAKFDVNEWSKEALYTHDLTVFDGYLGTGRCSDYAGARGTAIWKFVAPEGAEVEKLVFDATGRLTKGADSIPHEYSMRISYSFDGKEYVPFASEGVSSKTTFFYDLSSVANGREEIYLMLNLWGDYWHTAGLQTLNVRGSYRYSIEYHTGNGSCGDNPGTYSVDGREVALKDAIAPEYFTFGGWYLSEDFSDARVDAIPAGTFGKLDLYARYVPDSYSVSYHLNGGTNPAENEGYYYAYSGRKLADATRNGYRFAGWYTNAEFSGGIVSEIPAGTEEDVELYAEFVRIYKITFLTGGGELEDKPEYFTEEDEVDLPLPHREGYRFLGWYDKEYAVKYDKIEKGTTSPMIFYAKWEAQNDPEESVSKGKAKGCAGSASALTPFGAGIAFAVRKLRKKNWTGGNHEE